MLVDGTTNKDDDLDDQEAEVNNGKDTYGKYMLSVMRNYFFEKEGPGHVVTHSIKKYIGPQGQEGVELQRMMLITELDGD